MKSVHTITTINVSVSTHAGPSEEVWIFSSMDIRLSFILGGGGSCAVAG